MHYGDVLRRLASSQLRVAESIYGADVEIYAPESADVGVRDSSPEAYQPDPYYRGKLLIPELIVYTGSSSITNFQFEPDVDYTAQSLTRFPKYSKIILVDDHHLGALNILEANPVRDADRGVIYYEYRLQSSTIIPSNSTGSSTDLRSSIIADEQAVQSALEELESIEEDIVVSDSNVTLSYSRIE